MLKYFLTLHCWYVIGYVTLIFYILIECWCPGQIFSLGEEKRRGAGDIADWVAMNLWPDPDLVCC